MPSILIFGSSKENRNKKIKSFLDNIELEEGENNPDLLEVSKPKDKTSIGIKQIRESISFLNKRPFSHKHKAIVIKDADILTVQAQNALLKTLEEHADYAYVILSTKTEDKLLETVISRCKRIRVRDPQSLSKPEISIEDVISKNPGNRLSIASDIAKKDNDKLLLLLENWVVELRKKLSEDNPKITVKNIELINKVLKDIEQTNINTKFALENLLINLE